MTLPSDLKSKLEAMVATAELASKPTVAEVLQAKRSRPSRPKSMKQAFVDLDAWHEEASAGMPDDALATAANVSMYSVLEWRKLRKISRLKGPRRLQKNNTWAIDSFGDSYSPSLHAVDTKLKGQWEIPEFALRTALNYDLLTRSLYHLHFDLGMEADALASAFGLRVRDIEMAIAVEVSHLQKVGSKCSNCGRPCDPVYGKECSARCR